MLIYDEVLLLGVPTGVLVLTSISTSIVYRLVKIPSRLSQGVLIGMPAVPVLVFYLFRILLIGTQFAVYDPTQLGLTWSLVLNSLIAHGASFLFLNDQLKSPSLYVRTVGRMYVVLVSVSLSLTILLPFLIMTFGTIVVR